MIFLETSFQIMIGIRLTVENILILIIIYSVKTEHHYSNQTYVQNQIYVVE